jgi:hypothetical protein
MHRPGAAEGKEGEAMLVFDALKCVDARRVLL